MPHTRVLFQDNYALYRGGAISVSERSDLVLPCFFQISDLQFLPDPNISISLRGNYAEEAGSVLFGGSVDRCIVATRSSLFANTSTEVFDYLVDIGPQSNGTSLISSDPSVVCICHEGKPLCSSRKLDVILPPGSTIFVPFVTVGMRNGITPSSVYAIIVGLNTTLGQSQQVQNIGKTCTNLNFTVKSTESETSLVVRTSSLSVDGSFSISFEVLPCPEGFVLDDEGECVCDPIRQLSDYSIECDIDTQTVRRPGESWVNSSYQGPNRSYDGVMVFLNCPYDYCTSSDTDLLLSEPDSQCNFNRTGILCGACKPGLSLTTGSSRCAECSNYYTLLIIVYFLAGLLLVAVLFALNLTITQGTLGGIIFYANVLNLNGAIFYPPGRNDVLTVIVSWINLDTGFDTCNYDGMDGFAQVWLGFAFPFYIWLIVVVIIVASRFSPVVSRLCGSRSVPVLATMMLLSYNKLLRIVITSLSSTTLVNPDGSYHTVWTFDGNLDYLRGKHIALGTFSFVVLLFFIIPYTLLLVLVPLSCVQARSTHRLLSWVNTLKPFFDAHQGPLKDRFRNWTGVLLLVRVVLFVVGGLNVGEHNDDVVLFVIAMVVLALVAFAWVSGGGVYKKWPHNLLEASFYVNLEILTIATLFVRQVESRHQVAILLTSGWIAMAELGGIFLYHTYVQLSSLKIFKERRDKVTAWMNLNSKWIRDNNTVSDRELETSSYTYSPSNGVKVTTVSFNKLREPLLDED